MRVEYDVLDPTGNITILVRTPVAEADQPAIAARLMELEPEAEQVGFISREAGCDLALRMAGGEFCGNASLCAGVIAAMERERAETNRSLCKGTQPVYRVTLQVSGASEPVQTELRRQAQGIWFGTVDMPGPLAVYEADLQGVGRVPVVRFEGIAHVIISREIPQDTAENLAAQWCETLAADAVGLLFVDADLTRMTPLVYVPAAGTLCWERSCASGTTAVCAWLVAVHGFGQSAGVSAEGAPRPGSVSLRQPGGVLHAQVDADGRIRLSGQVRLLRHGLADLS